MKDYTIIYAIIFWLSMLSIMIWVVLKAAGIINTPEIIELLPIISAVFGAGAFFQMVLDMKVRLSKLEIETRHIDKRITILEYKN